MSAETVPGAGWRRAGGSDVTAQPRKDLPYTLEIDGVEFEGTTTADGDVEQEIRADAQSGTLTLNPDRSGFWFSKCSSPVCASKLKRNGSWPSAQRQSSGKSAISGSPERHATPNSAS